MAVRPTGPRDSGVHFFPLQRDISNKHKSGHFTTTFPSFSETSKLPWNPSAYFYDFGMWTACKESRAVVISLIRKPFETQDLKHSGRAKVRHNQKDITFGLFPEYDLICIQLPDTETLGWICPDPLGNFNNHSRIYYACIGFEYDVSWTFDPDKDNIHDMTDKPGTRGAFLTLLTEIVSGGIRGHLYLIQHGAKLRPNKPGWGTFYGNGFNLTVAADDDANMEDKIHGMNAWEFIGTVTFEGETYWEGWKDDQHEGVLFPGEHVDINADWHIDVLVCQEA
ncbi:hypothetical protein CSOJ01_12995 [Colletotrichum sojae]|uniref:Uncharacterized protein n=1 Tax=Colletotrichum sojae TaxID=2175907 RepID=A0A8H6MLN6_9PEZI|nr:hypothetical protein CSOJ01_12995 [Colletotrichum sojae]